MWILHVRRRNSSRGNNEHRVLAWRGVVLHRDIVRVFSDLDIEDEDDDENGSFSIKTKQRIFRTILLWFVLLPASFVCYGDLRLALTEAVTGALCTMMTSLVLPCAILVVLMPKMNSWKKYLNIILAILGVVFGVIMAYGDFRKAL